jgi:hypothetical protein
VVHGRCDVCILTKREAVFGDWTEAQEVQLPLSGRMHFTVELASKRPFTLIETAAGGDGHSAHTNLSR